MSIWNTAKQMAAQTPDNRNRYIDFLRALSILVVVTGHWLIAGFYYAQGEVQSIQVLAAIPETQPLTWLFQVMPIFFIVGGYSNAISLQSAAYKNLTYSAWLATRLDRLVRPLLPLIAVWSVIAVSLLGFGHAAEDVQLLTQIALIPIWFLAIYIVVVVLAPLTYKAWERFGLTSFFGFALMAVAVDTAVFSAGFDWAGWSNYLWVWLAVHQLGYAWQANKFSTGFVKTISVSALAWAVLAALVFIGPYPLAMVGSPDPDISNTLPPKITLLALGVAQFSLLLLLERPANRWLSRVRVWAVTVLINSMIMTLYLWHITVMLLVVLVGWLLGGVGLTLEPGTAEWWLTRPIWIGLLFVLLVPTALALSPIERSSRPAGWQTNKLQLVLGALLICIGIALLSMFGIGNAPILFADVAAVVAIFSGAVISGVLGVGPRERGAE